MFKSAYFTLFRKFLLLAVLSAGVFFIASNRPVGAVPCCMGCDNARAACLDYCYSDQIKEWMIPGCVAECNFNWDNCSQFCEEQPGIFGCPT
jgi:hypothetical protein